MTDRCPVCGKGTLRRGNVHETMFGVELGDYRGEICDQCGEAFLSTESMRKVEARAKELGLWGLASKVKIARSGNSLVVRIPAKLARHLKLKNGQEVLIAPEKANRLVLELA
jgi:YgiT-type zinc finger domain-containing protein